MLVVTGDEPSAGLATTAPATTGGTNVRTPSILDSPTLARVERARLRLEASKSPTQQNGGGHNREDSLERSILDPKYSFLVGKIPIESITGPIKRGLLWQQRDRLFSRWKERYFILTRDYLHCFKRASGSATDRISDMGQFIFKVKLVDVEKVEWLNRRSYSVIGLFLGREGRVLLRTDVDLEDWFEALEQCTHCSKQRRQALRAIQGPRSRASLAAPISHASLQTTLGGNCSGALEDWLLMRQKNSISMNGGGLHAQHLHYPMLLSDSVPDLSGSGLSAGITSTFERAGISTNHSTPMRVPAHHHLQHSQHQQKLLLQHQSKLHAHHLQQQLMNNNNNHSAAGSRYSMGSASPANGGYGNSPQRQPQPQQQQPQHNGSSSSSGFCGTPLRQYHQIHQQPGTHGHGGSAAYLLDDDDDDYGVSERRNVDHEAEGDDERDYDEADGSVQLRARRRQTVAQKRCDNDASGEWMYRRPAGPVDLRHHSLLTDIDVSACDSGLDTPPSTTHRSSHNALAAARHSTDTGVSSSRGTLVSLGGRSSFRTNNNSATSAGSLSGAGSASNTVLRAQEKLRHRNEIDLQQAALRAAVAQKLYAASSAGQMMGYDSSAAYDSNRNASKIYAVQLQQQQQHSPQLNGNQQQYNGGQHPRYQHPALAAIINDAQGKKFRDRSYSDIQQQPRRTFNNNSPSPRRRPFVANATPTRV